MSIPTRWLMRVLNCAFCPKPCIVDTSKWPPIQNSHHLVANNAWDQWSYNKQCQSTPAMQTLSNETQNPWRRSPIHCLSQKYAIWSIISCGWPHLAQEIIMNLSALVLNRSEIYVPFFNEHLEYNSTCVTLHLVHRAIPWLWSANPGILPSWDGHRQ